MSITHASFQSVMEANDREIDERRETLAKLRRIKDVVLFFSPTSKRTLSQLGMISILRF